MQEATRQIPHQRPIRPGGHEDGTVGREHGIFAGGGEFVHRKRAPRDGIPQLPAGEKIAAVGRRRVGGIALLAARVGKLAARLRIPHAIAHGQPAAIGRDRQCSRGVVGTSREKADVGAGG